MAWKPEEQIQQEYEEIGKPMPDADFENVRVKILKDGLNAVRQKFEQGDYTLASAKETISFAFAEFDRAIHTPSAKAQQDIATFRQKINTIFVEK